MQEILVSVQHLDRFVAVAGEEAVLDVQRRAFEIRERLAGRTIWNVNSTARGGGVAELLAALVGYARGAGLNARWGVITCSPEFFQVTKRLHHALHGTRGDGRPLDAEASAIYRRMLDENAAAMSELIRPDDIVILHDPQTAGLLGPLRRRGARVVWRCHVGTELRNEETDRGWAFLAPHLADAERMIFSRRAYVPEEFAGPRVALITPTIDPFTPKNEELSDENVRAILVHTGLVGGPPGPGRCEFRRMDGAPGRVDRRADIVRQGDGPTYDTPIVVQISRWDDLKDPSGVLHGFARWAARSPNHRPHLMLVGPTVHAVADDPEGAAVFASVLDQWQTLAPELRRRIQLVNLPMVDVEENAAIVNALQRHAAVVVQKSIAEGFGLTVTEAMWKGRPIIASAVGGIVDQIIDGKTGLLLHDPRNLDGFAGLLEQVLGDRDLAQTLGANARARVASEFIGLRTLLRYAQVIDSLWSG